MRIAIDGHPLIPPRAGIGQYTYHLIRALARLEPAHQYIVMYPRLTRTLRTREVPVFAEKCVRVVSEGRLRFLVFRARRKLRRKLGLTPAVERSLGPYDVYHATNYVFTHSVKRARRVVTIHDMTLMLFPEWHPRARVSSMASEIARSLEIADHVLADSASTRDDIVKHFSIRPERISVVPLAAAQSFKPLPATEVQQVLSDWGLVPDAYLLFMGTIEPRKNLLRLLQAAELAGNRAGPLVLAGADGWRSDEVALRIQSLRRAGRLTYLGYVPDEARPALINGARGFVYPSLYEGFGLPVLEAMACGVPVLASNVSSLPEVVGDAGLMVEPGDVDAIAQGMVRLWEDETLRRELSARGLRRAAGFSWEKTARQTLKAYDRA
jgi:O-antigen biosynthesis alpha-1,3-mannosyltransferase